jgi:PKD repeat protein
VGQTVVFTAQRAQGSGNVTSAVLDFGDGSSVNLGTLSGAANVPHTYTQGGTYTARLTASDGNETSTAVQVVQVTAVTASVTASVTSGRTVSATATVSAPATQYVWTWGDNTTTTTTTATTTHTYTAVGPNFDISVTATLQAGGTITANTSVNVP